MGDVGSNDLFGVNLGPGGHHLRLTVETDIAGVHEIAVAEGDFVVPEPLTMLAVGLSLTGLGGYIRKRRRT